MRDHPIPVEWYILLTGAISAVAFLLGATWQRERAPPTSPEVEAVPALDVLPESKDQESLASEAQAQVAALRRRSH